MFAKTSVYSHSRERATRCESLFRSGNRGSNGYYLFSTHLHGYSIEKEWSRTFNNDIPKDDRWKKPFVGQNPILARKTWRLDGMVGLGSSLDRLCDWDVGK